MELLWILVLTVSAVGAQNCANQGVTATILIGVGNRPPPGNLNVIEGHLGGSLSLSCINQILVDRNGNNLDIVSYSWYRNGELLRITSSDIVFQSVRGTDGGVYECSITTNICTTQRSPPFTMNVSPDLMIVEPSSLTIEVIEGQPFTLNCQAPGWPTPIVQWLMSGSVLSENEYTVESASLSDAGNYSCRASNTLESIDESVLVLITALPPTTTDEIMSTMQTVQTTTDFQEIIVYNVTSDPLGFYIAIGVTAGVSLILGVISLFCCIITIYANCCYKRKNDEYTDYDEAGEEETREKNEDPMQYNTLNIAEIADPMGGGDSVVVVYQETEDEDEKADYMNSPSEIGEIV